MFMVMLTMTGNPAPTPEWMAEHKAWLQQGFAEGYFLASGNLTGQAGGGILVHGLSEAVLQQRLAQDPLVVHGVVSVTVIGMTPAKVDPRLDFLLAAQP